MVPSTIRLLSCLASSLVKSASESGEITLVLIVAIGCSPGISCCDSQGSYILSSSVVTWIVLIDIPCSQFGLSRNCWINSGAWMFVAGSCEELTTSSFRGQTREAQGNAKRNRRGKREGVGRRYPQDCR